MGIEKTLTQTGKNVAYNSLPWLDEMAAAAIEIGNRGLDPMLAMAAKLRHGGSLALDVLDPAREDERLVRHSLGHRVGRIVLVGRFEDDEFETAEQTANSLWQADTIDDGTIVGIRSLIRLKDADKRADLHHSADRLNDAIAHQHDITLVRHNVASVVVAPHDPARIPGRKPHERKAVYGAIQRADEESRAWIDARLAEKGYKGSETPRTATVLIAEPEIAKSVKGIKPSDLRNGGAAVLRAVQKRWKHRWQPLDRVSQPVQEESQPDDVVEVVTEDYVGRDRRFTTDRRQQQERIAIQHDRRRADRRSNQPKAYIH